MKRALIIYWSATRNTERVASAVRAGLRDAGIEVAMFKTNGMEDVDYFEYDLVCVGFPVYHFHPPEVVVTFLKGRFQKYRGEGRILPGAPRVPGKHALIFCTYSGPHSGMDEALPAVKYAGQFFVHMGIPVLDEWYVVGEFHGREVLSTQGKLGDIRGRPTEEELRGVRRDALNLALRLSAPGKHSTQ